MRTRLIFCCLAFAAALRAADAPEKESVSLSFSVVSWGDPIPDLYYKRGSRTKGIDAPAFNPSAPVQYSGPAELVLYRRHSQLQPPESDMDPDMTSSDSMPPASSDTARKPGKGEEIEVSRVLLPANESHVTLLMAPVEADRYQCLVIPGDPTKFPFGQAKLLNLYNQPLAIKFNRSETVLLKANESKVVTPGANSSLLIEVAAYKKNKWKRLFDNVFTLREDEQATVIFSRGDYKFFRTAAGDVESEVHVTVLRQKKEETASDKPGTR